MKKILVLLVLCAGVTSAQLSKKAYSIDLTARNSISALSSAAYPSQITNGHFPFLKTDTLRDGTFGNGFSMSSNGVVTATTSYGITVDAPNGFHLTGVTSTPVTDGFFSYHGGQWGMWSAGTLLDTTEIGFLAKTNDWSGVNSFSLAVRSDAGFANADGNFGMVFVDTSGEAVTGKNLRASLSNDSGDSTVFLAPTFSATTNGNFKLSGQGSAGRVMISQNGGTSFSAATTWADTAAGNTNLATQAFVLNNAGGGNPFDQDLNTTDDVQFGLIIGTTAVETPYIRGTTNEVPVLQLDDDEDSTQNYMVFAPGGSHIFGGDTGGVRIGVYGTDAHIDLGISGRGSGKVKISQNGGTNYYAAMTVADTASLSDRIDAKLPKASTRDSINAVINNARPVLVYEAKISQTGTNAPTATAVYNATGTTATWSRTDVGDYKLTFGAAISGTADSISVSLTLGALQGISSADPNSTTIIECYTGGFDGDTGAYVGLGDAILVRASIQVWVLKP